MFHVRVLPIVLNPPWLQKFAMLENKKYLPLPLPEIKIVCNDAADSLQAKFLDNSNRPNEQQRNCHWKRPQIELNGTESSSRHRHASGGTQLLSAHKCGRAGRNPVN